MIKELYTCVYSATGIYFCCVYEHIEEVYSATSLSTPDFSTIMLHTKEKVYESVFDMHTILYPGVKRNITSGKEIVCECVWSGQGYLLADEKQCININVSENGYKGTIGNTSFFKATLLNPSLFQKYEKTHYDITRIYKIEFNEEISEILKLCISTFPMLRFAK